MCKTLLLLTALSSPVLAADLCPATYPDPSTFHVPFPAQPRAATVADGLTPRIEHVRNGVVIATYRSFASDPKTCTYKWPTATMPMDLTVYAGNGCGPFGGQAHIDLFNVTKPGDVFRVYPAVYSGAANSFIIQPRPDYYQGPMQPAAGITIQGITVNGIRPVLQDVPSNGMWYSGQAPFYFFNASDIIIDNLDFDGAGVPAGSPGRIAALYVNGVHNFSLSNSRLQHFEGTNSNGILGTPNNSGVLSLDTVEAGFNGGTISSYTHQFYILPSVTDPSFTFRVRRLYSHDVHEGHLLKARAQHVDIQNSWFIGGVPQPNYTQAEGYDVDVPNGGDLVFKGNVLAKTASGPQSNGALLTFGVEGIGSDVAPSRPQQAVIQGNTFVTFAKLYDGFHPIWPIYLYGFRVPIDPLYVVPAVGGGTVGPNVTVSGNIFVGFCDPATNGMNYRGDNATVLGFEGLNPDYSINPNTAAPVIALPAAAAGCVPALVPGPNTTK